MKKLPAIPASLFVLIGVISAICVISDSGCANIIPPQGGFRDSLPPVLLKVSPPDSTKNFTKNEITFTFDEFVDLDNIYQNMLVTPVPKTPPNVESKLRTITVKLKDSLEPNTTYTINFGNGIKDVNEGNVLKNLTYIFSTGHTFDSLTLAGKVILAETGKIDTNFVVMLHKRGEDSALVNDRPRYVTRLDGQGNFLFHNLPAGTFYLYALKSNGGYTYSGKEVFAFADKPVDTRNANDSITLYAFEEKETRPIVTGQPNIRPTAGKITDKRLKIITNLVNGQLDLLNDLVISFDLPIKNLDTSKIHFSRDTSFIPLSGYQIITDSTRKKLTVKYNWKENTQYNIIAEKDFGEDTVGKKLLKTDTITFRTKRLSDYGSLKLRFKNFDASKNPVLQFVQGDVLMRSVPLTSAELNLPLILPGDYDLRILFDRNKNGKWDTGEFFGKHLQPEIVMPVSRRITIKANWDNEFDIAL